MPQITLPQDDAPNWGTPLRAAINSVNDQVDENTAAIANLTDGGALATQEYVNAQIAAAIAALG